MKKIIETKEQRQSAIVAGLSIVIMTIAAGMANDVAIGPLIVEDNPPSTLLNILGSKLSFKLGFLFWMVILVTDVFAAWGFYIFLKPVSKNLSLIAAWFRLVYAAMLAVSIFNLLYIVLMIEGVGVASIDMAGNLSSNVLFYLSAFDTMFSVSLIVFSIHILFLGYLVIRSVHVPKILGILLIIGFFGYLIINISKLLFPQYDETIRILEWIFLIPMLSEVALGLWLLILGLRSKKLKA